MGMIGTRISLERIRCVGICSDLGYDWILMDIDGFEII